MTNRSNKHQYYDLLNLLGYGLAKFDYHFIQEFGCTNKEAFYQLFVDLGIVATKSVIKNRQDLFDPYFDNGRQGWWQKADRYKHRKILIDSLFGDQSVADYADMIKLVLINDCLINDGCDQRLNTNTTINTDTNTNTNTDIHYLMQAHHFISQNPLIQINSLQINPLMHSKFYAMQQTALAAELYFMHNYQRIDIFCGGQLQDARLLGDGYDFQVSNHGIHFLTEVKGIRQPKGKIRLTQKEYHKACTYKNNYILTVVINLDDVPRFISIADPIAHLEFKEVLVQSKLSKEYHLLNELGC